MEVVLEDGRLARVTVQRSKTARVFEVEAVQEVWRVAEAWWRESPVRRTYHQVMVDGGRALTLFQDEESGRWYEQRY